MSLSDAERKLLDRELDFLGQASSVLEYSYRRCMAIGEKADLNQEEQDQFEAFTSRFARLTDILIQRVFRFVDKLDLEEPGTVRDRINRAEKKALIASAETFAIIRNLRNAIAHEYLPEAIRAIHAQALKYAPVLLDSVGRLEEYCKRYG